MLECLILGDSIAEGIASALRAAALTRCAVVARTGTSSGWAASRVPPRHFVTAAIATSTNDARVPGLQTRLVRLRRSLRATRVLWIAPYDRRAAAQVVTVARAFGDNWMDLTELRTRDRIHPYSYRSLAAAVSRSGFAGR